MKRISRCVRKLERFKEGSKMKPHAVSVEMELKMADLYKKGYNTVELAGMFKCSHETIGYHLKKQGIILRKSGAGICIKNKRGKSSSQNKKDKIPLTNGMFALIDEEDYEKLSKYNWCASKERKGVYAVRKAIKGEKGWINGHESKSLRMHRKILNVDDKTQVDHINGNGLDNRKCNLRIVTARQNCQNKHIPMSSKYPGVYWDKRRNKWAVSITINGVKKFLGRFNNEKEAFECYRKKCEELGDPVVGTQKQRVGRS